MNIKQNKFPKNLDEIMENKLYYALFMLTIYIPSFALSLRTGLSPLWSFVVSNMVITVANLFIALYYSVKSWMMLRKW